MSVPQQIGRYRILEPIGSGGFATVWRAYDPDLDAPAAVKILADNWVLRTDIQDRFVEEARLLRRADSDRVVRVHDIGRLDDDRPYFVMSYADRGTLTDRLAHGPLPPVDAFGWAAEAARGIAVLHGIGVLHRDVKPSNILFGSTATGERLMVADLGLAKALANASGFTVAAGTPGYMAPEQNELGGDLDRRADVYALGALSYQMLTGRRPASAASREALVPPSRLRAGLPPDTDAVVMRALEHDRDRRWPDATTYAAALDRLREAAASASRTPAQDRTPAHLGSDRSGASGGSGGSSGSGGPTVPIDTHTVAPPSSLPRPEHPSFPGGRAPDLTPAGGSPTAGYTVAGATPVGPASGLPTQPTAAVAPSRERTPAEQAKRRRRLRFSLVAAAVVVALLATAGIVWAVLPDRVTTDDGSISVAVPRSWVHGEPQQNTVNLSSFGWSGVQGVALATEPRNFDTDRLDYGPGVTVVAAREMRDADVSASGLEEHEPRTAWSPCPDHRDTAVDATGSFTSGWLRTYPECGSAAGRSYAEAILVSKGHYGAQVFLIGDAGTSQADFLRIVRSVEIDGSAL